MPVRKYPDVPLTDERRDLAGQWSGIVVLAKKRWPQLYRLLGDEADSIANLALVVAARNWQPGRAAFSTTAVAYIRGHWLTAIARRRKEATFGAPSDAEAGAANEDGGRSGDPLASLAVAPEAAGVEPDERDELARAVALLPPLQREVIVRCVQGGESLRTVAEGHGLSRERARQVKELALQRLRRIIQAGRRKAVAG